MALTEENIGFMRMLLSDEAAPYTFSDSQLNTAATMFGDRWCRAASFLARRKSADLSRNFATSKSMGGTSVSTSPMGKDPSTAWSEMAATIDRFCTMYAEVPELMSYGPNGAGATSDEYRRQVFDLWMHANPVLDELYYGDPYYYDPLTSWPTSF